MVYEIYPEAFKKVLLILEDDTVQREILLSSGKRYFGDDVNCRIHAAESTNQAIEELEYALVESPDACLFAIMDYNMGENLAGERKPAESMFFNDTFLEFLDNGAVIVIYSGYPEQVRQSRAIYKQAGKKDNAAVLVAVKSEVPMDDLFRMLKAVKKERIGILNSAAKKFQHDLRKLLDHLKNRK